MLSMVSKKQLIRELEGYRVALTTLADAVHRHVDEAKKLGHQAESPLPIFAPTSSAFALDRLLLLELADVNALQAEMATLRANAEEAKATVKVEAKTETKTEDNFWGFAFYDGKNPALGVDCGVVQKAPEQVRRETLEKVIEALELDEYRGHPNGYPSFFNFGPAAKEAPNPDRFWADITTALRVRSEDAEAEADEAAEARIAAITGARRAADEDAVDGETILSSSGGDQ